MGKAAIGILMLDTKFPRVLGDIGHKETWDFPVHVRVVRRASASKLVEHDPAFYWLSLYELDIN